MAVSKKNDRHLLEDLNLDIRGTFDSFVRELGKLVDANWAAVALIGDTNLHFLTLSSETGSERTLEERVPIKGTATEWVVTHKEAIIEPDLARQHRFAKAENYLKQGIRSIVYLPLITKGRAIGSLVIASRRPNAYSQRQIMLLEQLASKIAMPVENSRFYAEVMEKARIDDLTGLLNRRSLDEVVTDEINRHSRYGGVFSLLILALDSFEVTNGKYGHLAGDKLLCEISSIMKNSIRSTDKALRYSGDEFAVLLTNANIDAAKQVAERIRKQVASKVMAGHIPVTTTLGLASWPTDGLVASEVIAAADAALNHAKRNGGNQAHCASETLRPLGNTMVSSDNTQNVEASNAVYALAAIVDARKDYYSSHWRKVKNYAIALAKALNLERPNIDRLETCALLHDIGKIVISDKIISKRGSLTTDEWKVIKAHPQVGANIVSHAPQLTPCIPGILYHHERFDGNGYPEGLKAENIPLDARILSIADAFAAMTSDRAYSNALPLKVALREMKQGSASQFDPNLVDVFLSIVEKTLYHPSRNSQV